MTDFNTGLRRHLRKAEIEYTATHGGGFVEFLKALTPEDITRELCEIGFKLQPKFDEMDDALYVETTSGISVDIKSGWCHKHIPSAAEKALSQYRRNLQTERDAHEE